MRISSKTRCPLVGAAALTALSILAIVGVSGCGYDTQGIDTDIAPIATTATTQTTDATTTRTTINTVSSTMPTETSSGAVSETTSVTTNISTTESLDTSISTMFSATSQVSDFATDTTTQYVTMMEVDTEQEYVDEVVTTPVYEELYSPISESDRILLCNLVGREYGSDYVSVYEKAKVVAVVNNRVNSNQFPNTVYEVVTQPYQFSGFVASYEYSYQVTDSVIEAVNYYYEHTNEFGDWLYFEGNGEWNTFY